MADDAGAEAAQPVEDGPLSARLESKAWKTRMDAYDELSKVRPEKNRAWINDSRYEQRLLNFYIFFDDILFPVIVPFLSFGKVQRKNLFLRSSVPYYTKLLEIAM